MRACHGGGDTRGGLLELCPRASSMAFLHTKARGQLTVKKGIFPFSFSTHLTNRVLCVRACQTDTWTQKSAAQEVDLNERPEPGDWGWGQSMLEMVVELEASSDISELEVIFCKPEIAPRVKGSFTLSLFLPWRVFLHFPFSNRLMPSALVWIYSYFLSPSFASGSEG